MIRTEHIRKYLSYLCVKAFDTTTPEGLVAERYRLAAWAALMDFASTGLGLVTLIISVPLTLPYLGQERFGVWMTVSSFGVLLSFMDFGVGNALINRVAAANATGDRTALRFTITHGMTILTVIGIVVGVLLVPFSSQLPWHRLIKVTTPFASEEARKAVLVFVILFAAGIPLVGVQKIFQGLQQAWLVHVTKCIGSLISIALIYRLTRLHAGSPELLLATLGVQTVMPLLLLALLVKKRLIAGGAPPVGGWKAESRSLVRIGGLFFVLQVGYLVGWSADPLMVSSLLGAAEVAKLVLVQRLFMMVSIPLSIMNAPLWGAYADAYARNDKAFIRQTLKKSLLGTVCGALIISSLIVSCSGFIFSIWTKGGIVIPPLLVLSYGIWIVIEATGNAFAMFLNGVGEIRGQVFVVVSFVLVAVPLKLYATATYGLNGIILATMCSYIIAVICPYVFIFRKRFLAYVHE